MRRHPVCCEYRVINIEGKVTSVSVSKEWPLLGFSELLLVYLFILIIKVARLTNWFSPYLKFSASYWTVLAKILGIAALYGMIQRPWMYRLKQTISILWSKYNIDEDLCVSTLISYISEHSNSYPSMVGEGFNHDLKAQMVLFLAHKYMADFRSTHCTPLPADLFRLPWELSSELEYVKGLVCPSCRKDLAFKTHCQKPILE